MKGRALVMAATLVVNPTRGSKTSGIVQQAGDWCGRIGSYRLLYDIVDHRAVFRKLEHRKCAYGRGRTN